jgi:hypothetical protein
VCPNGIAGNLVLAVGEFAVGGFVTVQDVLQTNNGSGKTETSHHKRIHNNLRTTSFHKIRTQASQRAPTAPNANTLQKHIRHARGSGKTRKRDCSFYSCFSLMFGT